MPPVNPEAAGIHGRGADLVIVALVFAGVATITVIGRILARTLTGRVVGRDDYAISASQVCYLAMASTPYILREYLC